LLHFSFAIYAVGTHFFTAKSPQKIRRFFRRAPIAAVAPKNALPGNG